MQIREHFQTLLKDVLIFVLTVSNKRGSWQA